MSSITLIFVKYSRSSIVMFWAEFKITALSSKNVHPVVILKFKP